MDYSQLADEELLRSIARADKDALGELYDRYGGLVFSIALKSVSHQETAEEITQDVFLRVWNNAGSYQAQKGKVSTWIASITRNRAIDMIRHYQIRLESQTVSWDAVPNADLPNKDNLEHKIERSERRSQVRSALVNLPSEQKDALALAYFLGYTHREIAETLGLPLGTVKTRIRLAMQKLRGYLNGAGPVD